jgi:hypothetical protein
MKRLFYSVFVTVLFSLSALAQNEGINFQGVARNAAGEVLVSQKINLRLSILLGSETGAVAYMETRQVTTNPQGVFAVVVGDDKALTKSINFSTINWTPAPKFIKVEMDPNAGSNYLVMGTSRLQAVPFAFYANGVDANNVKGVLPLSSGGTGVASISELKTSLGLDTFNSAALDTKVDKVAGKGLSTNDYTTAEKNKLEAITGTNTGDQDLSGYATTAQLATKANASDVTTSLATKANTTDVTTSLATKANAADVTTSLAAKANVSDMTTSLATKEDVSNKSNAALGTSTTFYPTQNAVKTYVDAQVLSATIADADASTKGKLQLAGDLAGTAASPSVVKLRGTPISSVAPTTAGQVLTYDANGSATWAAAASSGIPYTGATQAVNLGAFDLTVNGLTIGSGKNKLDVNVAIGKNALSNTITGFQGNYITAVGFEALKNDTWGYFNTGIGSSALFSNTTGLANTAVGSNSLYSNTTANYNTAVGTSALRLNTTGESNTATGNSALEANTTGSFNTAAGAGALKSNTTGVRNSASGFSALGNNTIGSNNTATGFGALEKNTNGGENTAHGAYALQMNTGDGRENSAFGFSALKSNTSGIQNTATGFNALSSNTIGNRNTATGWYALGLNTEGDQNSAFGWYALVSNTTGKLNTAVGEGALKTNRTGDQNSAFGQDALANNSTGKYNSVFGRNAFHFNSTGDKNTVLGWSAGNANTVGSNNTAIGAEATFGANNLTNATAIGYQANVNDNNKIRLGNGSVTVIEGAVSFTAVSDSRIKKNIVNSTYGLATVLQLRPVEYNLNSNDLKQVGFIAQEVQKLVPEVVTGKEGDLSKGEILGITYSNLVPVLTKAIQEQQKQIEDQNAKIAAQQKQIEELIKLVKGQ